jgi:hypothetical protein
MPAVASGIWINLENQFDSDASLFHCPTASACTGIWRRCETSDKCSGALHFTLCRLGTRGTLCSSCSRGYYEHALHCFPYQAGENEMWWVLGGVLVIAMIFGKLFSKCMLKGKPLPTSAYAPLSIGLNFWQILALFQSIRLDWPSPVKFMFTLVSLSNMNIEGEHS